MSARTTPPFRADHVGSLLRPPQLLAAREQRAQGAISAEELCKVEDQAIRDVVKMQENAGLKLATDGEFRRTSWHMDFISQIGGVKEVPSKIKVRFHTEQGDIEVTPPGIHVSEKLTRPKPIFVDHFKFLKTVTGVTPKITIPSPTILHFRGGRAAIDAKAYPDMAQFYADLGRVYSEEVRDLGDAGCRYLQVDDTNFAYLCDPNLRAQVKANIGEDPDKLPHVYASLINSAIATRPAGMAVCMHVCRGNNQSAWVAEGGYDPVAEAMFNELKIDGYFLEFDTDRAGGFSPLRFVPKGKIVVLGLVSSKRAELESKDALKRRIDEAAKYVPLEQLAISPQCGFSSTVEGNRVTIDDQMKKLRLCVEVAAEVWG